jgi:hypothetical protein
MPTATRKTWSQIVNDFWDLWNFANFIGAIDGKHVNFYVSKLIIYMEIKFFEVPWNILPPPFQY